MDTNGRSRDPKDELIVDALATGATYADAGKTAKVSPRTVRRRMEDPEFRADVNAARRERIQSIRGRLAVAGVDGVAVLAQLASEAASESVRLGAARALVQMAVEPPRGQLDLTGVSTTDIAKIGSDLFELAMRSLPEELHQRYALEVKAYLESGRMPS